MLVRELSVEDIPAADKICRVAFGTFFGVPDPEKFFGDACYVTRLKYPNVKAFAAEVDGKLVGSNFAWQWGEVGGFGPLSVQPDLQESGVGSALVKAAVDYLEPLCSHICLFTFATSAKHHHLYGKFGFEPRFLVPILSKAIGTAQTPLPSFTLASADLAQATVAATKISNQIYPGFDIGGEMQAVVDLKFGDCVLVPDGVAVCHHGAGSEAGSEAVYVKLAIASDETSFKALVAAVEAYAADKAPKVTLGVNSGRFEAYTTIMALGYKADMIGVGMERLGGKPSGGRFGYSTKGIWVLDDWR